MIYLILGSLLAALCGIGAALWQRRRSRLQLERLNAMLDAALRGDFRESDFDESLQSAVESRMAQYLAASQVSARNLAAEKDKLKTLIGDISHQTKTPVANLLLYAQLLAEQDLPPQAADLVTALSAQCEKLRFLIEALVKVSRLESGVIALHPTPCPVLPLLRRVAAQAEPAARQKGIALTVAPADTALTARLDEKWTAEALFNLVDNAIKYTPDGGTVRLSATGYELFCRLDVTDSGPGIPEEEQAKIFGRFYRAPGTEHTPGVGIGLYLARQIAAGQGGYCKVESQIGSGSRFSLFLPR